MRTLLIWLGAVLPMLPIATGAEQVAQARAFCVSLRFQRGTEPFDLYTLDLTTIQTGNNGELAMDLQGSYSHYSLLTMHDEVWFMDIPGTLALDVPMSADVNDDGFWDFFEVAQGVNAPSTGQYNFGSYGSGTVRASWSRAAGSRSGTCVLDFRVNQFQSLAVFTHAFELLEYTGPLSYTPGSNAVSGNVALTQTDNATSQLNGPVQFTKVPADKYNQLRLLAGAWTNELEQVLSFPLNYLERDARWPTNYYGWLEFDDGEPNTGEADYWLWMLSIDDAHDADHDGIPDFSDDPAAALPRRSQLRLTPTPTNLWLTISGDVGRTNHVQEAASLAVPTWQTIRSIRLTNDPQTVSLPLPANGPRFWRVLAE
jgi:hypothetical protein